jgi:hypothetical protein
LPPNEHSFSIENREKEGSKEQTTKRTTPNTAQVQCTSPSHDKPITTRFYSKILMSVSVRSLFTPDELARDLEWLKARDTLLEDNFVKQDVKRALELASVSQHPQCRWLTSLFAEKTVTTVKEARDVFLADEKKSPASLCFAACSLAQSMWLSCVNPLISGIHLHKQ